MKYAKLSALALVLAVLALSAGQASAQQCCVCHDASAKVSDRDTPVRRVVPVAAPVKTECGCLFGQMCACPDGECRCPGCGCRDCPGLVLICRRERPVYCPLPRRVVIFRLRR